MDCRSEGSLTTDNYASLWTSKNIGSRRHSQPKTITFNVLNDDVLLEIFGFYLDKDTDEYLESPELIDWITLVHVCGRWRSVVFQSQRRLNLRLLCTPDRPVRDALDIWPPLPLIIRDIGDIEGKRSRDNILAALERNDRVREIELERPSSSCSELEDFTNSAAMQKPFPELTHLRLARFDLHGLELPNSFLGRTAPRLQLLDLFGVSFPGLLKLLLSSTHLVFLHLQYIPGSSGYIPPKAMATSISALTSLESLIICFQHPLPRPASEGRRPSPPLPPRSILPSLTEIVFNGNSEYLEEILARIDAPRLNQMRITFFNQTISDASQLFRFIGGSPTLRAPENGFITLSSDANLRFTSHTSGYNVLEVKIPQTATRITGWQLSSLEHFCAPSFPPISTLKGLYIFHIPHPQRWQYDAENTPRHWLDLLRSFVAVKNLYLSKSIVPHVAPALQELVGVRTTEVLPSLENIFLEGFQASGPLHEGIEMFVAARRLVNRTVTVSRPT